MAHVTLYVFGKLIDFCLKRTCCHQFLLVPLKVSTLNVPGNWLNDPSLASHPQTLPNELAQASSQAGGTAAQSWNHQCCGKVFYIYIIWHSPDWRGTASDDYFHYWLISQRFLIKPMNYFIYNILKDGHHIFLKPMVTSSHVLSYQQSKTHRYSIFYHGRLRKPADSLFTLKKLEPVYFGILLKNDSNDWWIIKTVADSFSVDWLIDSANYFSSRLQHTYLQRSLYKIQKSTSQKILGRICKPLMKVAEQKLHLNVEQFHHFQHCVSIRPRSTFAELHWWVYNLKD